MDPIKPAAPVTSNVPENKSKNYLPIIILVIIVLAFCACIASVVTLLALANNNRDTNLNVSPTPVETSVTPTPTTTKAPEPTINSFFKKEYCSNIDSDVILPKDWFIHEEDNYFAPNTGSCYLTKENLGSQTAQFTTGLTVVKFFEASATVETTPSLFINRYLTNIQASETVIDSSQIETISDTPPDSDIVAKYIYIDTLTTRQYHGVYASNSADTIFIITFEAPYDEFNVIFENYGRDMVERVELNY